LFTIAGVRAFASLDRRSPGEDPSSKGPTGRTRIVRLCALACVTASLFGCSAPPPPVILVVIDTLRADRLEALGGARGAAPFLDSLAERSHVFHRAYAPSSWTSPSVSSLFTSRYPSQHRVTTFQSVIAEDEATLAEALRDAGYATAGFSANTLIRGKRGFAQGFEHFAIKRGVGAAILRNYERTDQTGSRALGWIDRLPAEPYTPFFVYLQVMDPHVPYAPSREALHWAFAGSEQPDLSRLNAAVQERKETPLDTTQKLVIERLYDAEVRSMDRAMERVLGGFAERGILDDAIVVIVSDHGEEFWDHGSLGHTNGLFDELIRVPLLIRLPRQSRRVDIREPVSLLDIAPTILDLVGSTPPVPFEGQSLRPLLSESAAGAGTGAFVRRLLGRSSWSPTPVVSELIQPEPLRRRRHERAVVIGSYKLIADVDGRHRYFDLDADPSEKKADSIPDAVKSELTRALAAFAERVPLDHTTREIPMDAESHAELKALGYIE
jgi:arylsulfatase A-like enzyme